MEKKDSFVKNIPVIKLEFLQRKDVKISIIIISLIGTILLYVPTTNYLAGLLILLIILTILLALLFLFNFWSIKYHLLTSYQKVY